MRTNILPLFFLFIEVLCQGQITGNQKRLFDYDKGQDLDFKLLGTKDTTQGTCYDIVYSSINSQKVTACLVIPKQKIREFPVVIFFPDNMQRRDSFLPEALALANDAFASLVIDAPWDRPKPYDLHFPNFSDPRKDFNAYRQCVLDVRRAIDLLETHSRIDHNRIAFVGNGYGAMTGAIVSGVENRVVTYILMNCSSSYTFDVRSGSNPGVAKARNPLSPEQINQYEMTLKGMNPSNYLPYHRNAILFFQFSQNDPAYNEQNTKEFIQLIPDPKTQKNYKTTAAELIPYEQAFHDREKWMKTHL
jgi:hypothetical protein